MLDAAAASAPRLHQGPRRHAASGPQAGPGTGRCRWGHWEPGTLPGLPGAQGGGGVPPGPGHRSAPRAWARKRRRECGMGTASGPPGRLTVTVTVLLLVASGFGTQKFKFGEPGLNAHPRIRASGVCCAQCTWRVGLCSAVGFVPLKYRSHRDWQGAPCVEHRSTSAWPLLRDGSRSDS